MSPKREDPPSNLRSLEARISNIARDRGRPLRRVQRVIANTVVGQMLPPSVVKGGTAMKLRVGEAASRFTPDLDAARSAEVTLDDYLDALAARLAEGWGGFTGELEELDPPQPEGVPEDYVMRPFVIRLAYQGRHWLSVPFELGHDEIGSTQRHELRIADDIVELFDTIGLDTPDPIPVLALDHQIAQKLHACTAINTKTGGNERAHDLVDLQILEHTSGGAPSTPKPPTGSTSSNTSTPPSPGQTTSSPAPLSDPLAIEIENVSRCFKRPVEARLAGHAPWRRLAPFSSSRWRGDGAKMARGSSASFRRRVVVGYRPSIRACPLTCGCMAFGGLR